MPKSLVDIFEFNEEHLQRHIHEVIKIKNYLNLIAISLEALEHFCAKKLASFHNGHGLHSWKIAELAHRYLNDPLFTSKVHITQKKMGVVCSHLNELIQIKSSIKQASHDLTQDDIDLIIQKLQIVTLETIQELFQDLTFDSDIEFLIHSYLLKQSDHLKSGKKTFLTELLSVSQRRLAIAIQEYGQNMAKK